MWTGARAGVLRNTSDLDGSGRRCEYRLAISDKSSETEAAAAAVETTGDDILRDFFLGFVRLHVLYHAGHEPVCGVDLMAELRHHGYGLTPGTLYPLLHRLERAGHLQCEGRRVGARWRKYYRLTDQGARVLADARRRLPALVGEVLMDAGPVVGADGGHTAGGAVREARGQAMHGGDIARAPAGPGRSAPGAP